MPNDEQKIDLNEHLTFIPVEDDYQLNLLLEYDQQQGYAHLINILGGAVCINELKEEYFKMLKTLREKGYLYLCKNGADN